MKALNLNQLRKRRRRGGTVLVLFAMLLFAFLGLAALVIDIGFARLARRQMQSAANSAALEGLRGRDSLTDTERRENASDIVAATFDDDLNPTNGDPRNFGAGPVIQFSGGIPLSPEFNASELLTVPPTPVYKPTRSDNTPGLELNLGNQQHGDMVAGTFLGGAFTEAGDYSRGDFSATGDTAFLVRMRRTRGDNTLDAEAGVSSRGPVVPYLFGRGSLIAPDSRGRGITVRATAIADARIVKSVGRFDSANSLTGAMPIVIFSDQWDSAFPDGTAVSISVAADGNLTIGSTTVGYVTDATGAGQATIIGDATTIQAVPTPASFVTTVSSRSAGYVPIIAASTNTVIPNRVIGFGYVEPITASGTTLVVTRLSGRIASENASPVLSRQLDAIFGDSTSGPDAELESLFQEHAAMSAPLLAPALVH